MAETKMTPDKTAYAQMLLDQRIPVKYVAERTEVSRQIISKLIKRGVLTKK